MRRPFFRRDVMTWYVLVDGKQVPLGRDERFKAPPKESPKEPPKAILTKYHAIMQKQAEPADRQLSFCIDQYTRSLDTCTEGTRSRAAGFLGKFLAHAGDLKVSALKVHHVTEFIKANDWKPNSVRNVIGTINACLNFCEREGWIDKNPLRGKVRLPKVQRRELNLTTDEQLQFEEAATGPFRVFLVALRELGARPGELRSARVEDCDLERGVLKVSNKTRNKTGVEERPIILTTRMVELCRGLIGERKEGWLFRNSFGDQWGKSAIRNRMVKLCGTLGVSRVPYEVRHKFCSDALNLKGVNPSLVALQMGHTDLKMMMKHYLHADADAIRKAFEEG